MDTQKLVNWAALVLVIVGGLNWGLVGLLNMNLVETVFSSIPTLVTVVYVLVGVAALYMIYYAATKMK